MSTFTMRLPDVGEGVAEAELVEWLVAVGDEVTPDTAVAEVLTDKATVEISAPVAGVVAALHGEPGDVLPVGSDFLEITTAVDVEPAAPVTVPATKPATEPAIEPATEPAIEPAIDVPPRVERAGRVQAAPAVRGRAKELGIDLARVHGTGPEGRVLHADLDRAAGAVVPARRAGSGEGVAGPVRGVRRQIARRLTAAWQEIPHITYVEAIDVTELERLRAELNADGAPGATRLTIIPFLALAIARAAADQPTINAHYDHATETLTTFEAVHVGIATQTDEGLRVPVVRHVEALGIREIAAELARVSGAARDGTATREELTGSTISITSLGALGGLVTTPILNAPEVAIVGVNKIETRPVWQDGAFVPRRVMNLSSSFDHRMVDGWDAATFVQRIKHLLETPALLFVD